jgi:succinate-acetate transporter protein
MCLPHCVTSFGVIWFILRDVYLVTDVTYAYATRNAPSTIEQYDTYFVIYTVHCSN